MYLILTKKSRNLPQSWCTCSDEEVNSVLLELGAIGYGQEDEIYLLHLAEAQLPILRGKLKVSALDAEIGIQPFSLSGGKGYEKSSTETPDICDIDQMEEPAYRDEADEAIPNSGEYRGDEASVSQEDEEVYPAAKKMSDEEQRELEAKENAFVSTTSMRFSYLDRIGLKEPEAIAEGEPEYRDEDSCIEGERNPSPDDSEDGENKPDFEKTDATGAYTGVFAICENARPKKLNFFSIPVISTSSAEKNF